MLYLYSQVFSFNRFKNVAFLLLNFEFSFHLVLCFNILHFYLGMCMINQKIEPTDQNRPN